MMTSPKSLIFVLLVVLLHASVGFAWIQDVDLALPREVDPENPISAHESDCHVFYVYNFPMTCGEELVFDPANLACRPAADVAASRPECAK